MKPIYFVAMVAGIGGSIIAQLLGGWTYALTALCILMALDYVTGLIVAGVFHASPKSVGGGLESRAGLKGLLRKFAIIVVVVVAHLMDTLIGTNYLRDGCAIAFCLNEIISLIENLGLMGAPIPAVIMRGIDMLKTKVAPADEPKMDVNGTPGEENQTAALKLPQTVIAANAEAEQALNTQTDRDGLFVEAVSDGWPIDEEVPEDG